MYSALFDLFDLWHHNPTLPTSIHVPFGLTPPRPVSVHVPLCPPIIPFKVWHLTIRCSTCMRCTSWTLPTSSPQYLMTLKINSNNKLTIQDTSMRNSLLPPSQLAISLSFLPHPGVDGNGVLNLYAAILGAGWFIHKLHSELAVAD